MNVAMQSILVLKKRPVSIRKENSSVCALKDMSEMENTTALVSDKFAYFFSQSYYMICFILEYFPF